VLCLVLVPVAIALLWDGWIYSVVGYLDPWINIGYFIHYYDPNYLPDYYKSSRLPWLIPAYGLYHTVGPLVANFILHVGCLVASAVLVYLALARLIWRRTAFLAAALLCTYYPFHGVAGWDYQNAPAGALYALALYLLTRAAQASKPRLWLVGAGAAFGAAVHSNIVFVNLAPGLAAIYLVARGQRPTLASLAIVAAWALAGFLGLTALFCVVAGLAGRNPLFFWPVVKLAIDFTADASNNASWWLPWSSHWFMTQWAFRYLFGLGAVGIAAVVWLTAWGAGLPRRRGEPQLEVGPLFDGDVDYQPRSAVLAVLVGQYLFLLLLWVFWQYTGATALQPDYFSYPLIIPAFLALGAMAGPATKRDLIALGCILVAVVLSAHLVIDQDLPGRIPKATWCIGLMSASAVAAIVMGGLFKRTRVKLVLVSSAIFLAGYALGQTESLWSQPRRPFAAESCERLNFLGVVRLNTLAATGPHAYDAKVWMGPDDFPHPYVCGHPLSYFRASLAASSFRGIGANTNVSAADLSDTDVAAVLDGAHLVAVVKEPSRLPELVARFARAGRRLTLVSAGTLHLDPDAAAPDAPDPVFAVYRAGP
jgi:hypothetical protein